MTDPNAKILVVDDVAENRDLLLRRLTRLGFSLIDQAANGVEALAAIGSKAYDLVLLDIMMPELDGFGVLEALRRDGRINELPVIVISALDEIEPVVRCIELGAADFIVKPFNPTLLRARVLTTLEKKALTDRTRDELRRKQLELNEARTLQLALAPPPFRGTMSGRSLSIDVLIEPAKEVGGDLVDHFRVGEDLVVLALGDVSDKGAGAALMMARTHAMLRALTSRADAAALFRAPQDAIGIVNKALAQGNESCMFVTFLLASFDLTTGRLTYVRAGHVPPFHRNGTGKVARLERLGGPPLGLVETTIYQADSVALSPGDRLLIVTDGFTEAHDPGGSMYGEARVENFLTSLEASEPEPLKRLAGQVRAFESGRPAFDDMAAILLSLESDVAAIPRFETSTLPTPEAISDLTDHVMAFLSEHGVEARPTHHTALILNEVLTNLGTHGDCRDRPARIALAVAADKVAGEIIDGGPPFDPRLAPPPALDIVADERPIGGLGLHLVRTLSRDLEYTRRNGENCTTFAISRGNDA
jgi:sigma-B regulation protein RsbU (phosphoserine phosphatase)